MIVTSSSMTDTHEGQSWCRLESALMALPSYVVIERGSPTAIRYRDDIFDSILRTFAIAIGDDFVLMHENTPPQDARVVQWYMEDA